MTSIFLILQNCNIDLLEIRLNVSSLSHEKGAVATENESRVEQTYSPSSCSLPSCKTEASWQADYLNPIFAILEYSNSEVEWKTEAWLWVSGNYGIIVTFIVPWVSPFWFTRDLPPVTMSTLYNEWRTEEAKSLKKILLLISFSSTIKLNLVIIQVG